MAKISSLLKSPRTVLSLVLVYLVSALAFDLATPRGHSDWVLYLLAVLLVMRKSDRHHLLIVAAAGSVFTVLGLFFSPPGQPFWVSATSRFLALILIWTTVAVAMRWRRADERLRKLEKAVSGSGEIVLMTDAKGIITFVNPAFSETYGYSAEEVVGKTTPRILKGGLVGPRDYEAFWKELLEKRLIRREFINKTKDGRLLAVEASANAIVDSEGKIIGFLGIQPDITERKRAEEELKRLNRALRTISECTQALVRVTDEAELLRTVCQILVDHGGLRMAWVGYAEQDEAKSVRPVAFAGVESGYLDGLRLTWADQERGRGPTGTAIRTGRPSTARIIHDDPNFGPWREEALRRGYASSIALPLVADGRTLGALTVYSEDADAFDTDEIELLRELAADLAFGLVALRNRNERARAEAALRESEDRYRDLVEHSQDLICTHDLEGRLLSLNPEPARILGFSREELLSTSMRDLLAPEVRDQFDGYLERIRKSGEDSGLLRVRTREGKDRVWEYHNTLRTDGLPRPIVRGLAHDITDRLEAEKALRKTQEQFLQAQKMEAVGRLAGGVAHDFNNLLTVINGYTEMLLARMPAESGERGQLEEIKMAGARAATLTRQLLAFSRKQVVVPSVLDLNAVVERMQTLLRRLIGEDIRFVPKFSRSLGRIRADAGQIEQVIMNLCVNARDAMPKGGTLTIETANTDLQEDYAKSHPYFSPGNYVVLAVSDIGCGMDAETKLHIFEPFFTTKGQGKGTGLGLSTVYGIVKQSGGHINVYSELGQGTTFRIYFPRINEPESKTLEKGVETVPVAGTETVLLVEDEPGVRAFAQEVLEAKGYTVLAAAHPNEAFVLSEKHRDAIHLLLTDVIMPGINGKELADRLKKLRSDIKVLFVSGYTAEAIAHHGILEAGVSFLSKPYSPSDLLRKVRQTLDGAKP